MFKKNTKHEQVGIFDWDLIVPNRDKLENSIWNTIKTYVFEKVDESRFSVLYSDKTGRPNAPINSLIALLTIKELHDWSFRELENHLDWHIGVQYACGINIGDKGITLRTITNFIRYLREYQKETGTDLFDLEFKRLVRDQINLFIPESKIARTDSTYVSTNICSYNRLQFLIETIKRVYRILNKKDRKRMDSMYPDYIKSDADNYVYHLRGSDIDEEFRKIAHCHYTINKIFGDKYAENDEWKLFKRIYSEQFKPGKEEDKIELKPSDEMTSSCVRGIDDPEATLRHKSGINHIGYVGNVVETADPENELNLICDATLYPNNVPDNELLADSFDELKEETLPRLEEIHFDAGYGSKIVDEKLAKHSVKGIQTAIKGVRTDHRMDVTLQDGVYYAKCTSDEIVLLERTRKAFKASFPKRRCSTCKHLSQCPVKYLKKYDTYVYYIRKHELSKRLRLTNIKTIPKERQTIRSGVEATVRQFKCRTRAGKTRLRGCYRHKLWFQFTALAINLTRIYQYSSSNPKMVKILFSKALSQFACLLNGLHEMIFRFLIGIIGKGIKYFRKITVYPFGHNVVPNI